MTFVSYNSPTRSQLRCAIGQCAITILRSQPDKATGRLLPSKGAYFNIGAIVKYKLKPGTLYALDIDRRNKKIKLKYLKKEPTKNLGNYVRLAKLGSLNSARYSGDRVFANMSEVFRDLNIITIQSVSMPLLAVSADELVFSYDIHSREKK